MYLKRILSFFKSKLFFVGILILAQLIVLAVLIVLLSYQFYWFYILSVILSFIASVYVVNREDNPSFKILWVLLIMAVPVMGGLFYVLFGGRKVPKELRIRDQRSLEEFRQVMKRKEPMFDLLREEEPQAYKQASYCWHSGNFPIYEHCEVTYFPLGELKFQALIDELKKAKHYIFLEYFIIAEGIMWNTVLDILKDKVKEGVDVRLIYDDAGCITTLPPHYDETLRRYGIKAKVFNPIEPHLALQMNNRDHRKIAVIDGEVAFTGGVNLADEYINQYERFGHWKDMAVMVKGEAVQTFTVLFLQFWNFDEEEKSDPLQFISSTMSSYPANGYVIPFCDSPTDEDYVGQQTHINLINSSCQYLYASTPYLIIDQETKMALMLAAKNGVDVRILVPHIPDKKIVFEVTRSNYERLIEAGVKIYEYTPGFVHGKVMLADDQSAVVGTVNMDYRSYYLHYECGVWMYQTSCLHDIRKDFEQSFAQSHLVTLEECKDISIVRRFVRAFLNIISPIM
ncbi:cardiolipin synthase [Merdibacter massiliensis]|uniref:cardiolipin synthase n=1 Tax=Merdibacter massiliensis TaxID=1871030 RepID=UPI00096A805C|nr:cardiolipin synthase [Merdibacter massiliensis]